ncbi:MAG: glycoside hydrolase family 3 C-terminal domain-containing protein [Actinomycetota bacterium]
MASDPASIVAQLSLDEQISLLSGADVWRTVALPDAGIGAVKVTDGPNGTRGDGVSGATAVCLPATIGLAASFDRDLAVDVGRLLGREVGRKEAQVLLAPTINMARHPLGGRNFESFGEDPVLTAAMAVSYVDGVQSEGVGACAKHFVANDVEYARLTVSSEVSEAVLREIYLAPFEAVATAGVWSIMAAYPMLNGRYCTEHEWLLTDVLRTEWGFDGLVMSDWGATLHPARPITAGLDLEMPGPALTLGPKLRTAVDAGEVDAADVAARATQVVRLAQRTARLGAVAAQPEPPERSVDDPADQAVARRAATDGMVLLHNAEVLPFAGDALTTVALIGPNAEPGTIQGGGSAQVPAHYTITPREGMAAALPGAEVMYRPGCFAHRYLPLVNQEHWQEGPTGGPDLSVATYDSDDCSGDPVGQRATRSAGAFIQGDPADRPGSMRWTGHLEIDATGTHHFGVLAVGRSRVVINSHLVADNWTDPQPGDAFFQFSTDEVVGAIDLTAGSVAEIVVEWSIDHTTPLAGIRFGWLPPVDEDAMLDDAVAAASTADAAVVVVGLNHDWETESHDRRTLDLPGRQDELVRRVAAANPNTVVAINAGSPVSAPWLDEVGATLMCWYPGQEFGAALADVVLGVAEPGGRLPVTWPVSVDDAPFPLPTPEPGPPAPGAKLEYEEELLIGYRAYDHRGLEPLVPFGFGLGYTSFDLGVPEALGAAASGALGANDAVAVRVPVRNTGDRAGKCVVQAYVEAPEAVRASATPARPVRALAAFASVHLPAGAEAWAELSVPARAFHRWADGGWTADPGAFTLHIGTSSRDLAHQVEVVRSLD